MANILVTGANRGIGLELCRQLCARGDSVIGVCRGSSKELDQLGVKVISGVDVSDSDSVAGLAEQLANTELDILINNAGILTRESIDDFNIERIRKQFEVNCLGPMRVCLALLPILKQGSKIGIVSSRVGSIGDNGSGGNYGYRMSKAAVNMAGVNLAHDLREKGIAVFLLHPGMVATEMTNRNGIPAAEAASGLIARIDELDLDQSGSFWHANGEQLPW